MDAARAMTGSEAARGDFLLSIDGAGQYLAVSGGHLVLGHERGGAADLAFLADVEARHALLERRDTFRDGVVWTIEPCAGASAPEPKRAVVVNGARITEPTRLASGDAVRLAPNLAFRFVLPDPSSQSALLEIEGGVECSGAQRILLFASGEGGRVRIGRERHRHVTVPKLEHEIALVLEESRLRLSCGEEILGGAASRAEDGPGGVSMPVPPPQRIDLAVGRPVGGRPPFGLVIGPVEAPADRGPRAGGAWPAPADAD